MIIERSKYLFDIGATWLRAVVISVAQMVENLQQPKRTVPHQTDKHPGWRMMYYKLGDAWFWLVSFETGN